MKMIYTFLKVLLLATLVVAFTFLFDTQFFMAIGVKSDRTIALLSKVFFWPFAITVFVLCKSLFRQCKRH